MTKPRRKVKPEHLVLYRFFAADGALLYVGKSVQAWARFGDHQRGSRFYREAAQVTLQRGFASEAELASAEVLAIRTEKPRFNNQHNAKPKPRRRSLVQNPCGGLHYCGEWYHASDVCRRRDAVDLAIADRVDAGESVESIAADLGWRPDLVRATRDRVRRQQAEGIHGCWECSEFGVARATVYNAKQRVEGQR